MTTRTIGITGANGFIGRHVAMRLGSQDGWTVVPIPRAACDDAAQLADLVGRCDAIVHLAGVNRGTEQEITEVNAALAARLVTALETSGRTPHVVYSSTTQETADNVYGRAKRAAGDALAAWGQRHGAPVSVLVIPNVYGAGCRPFYNSVVATFCHQLAHGETPTILQDREVEFLCVSELADEILQRLRQPPAGVERPRIAGTATMSVSRLLETLKTFRDSYFEQDIVPSLADQTAHNLYATFLSYLPADKLRHCPPLHTDPRGSLVEVIKLAQGGQVFFSTTKPGVIRGNHFHTRKFEWFCVLKGEAVIRLRRIGTQHVEEFRVSGAQPQFISIPVMHTHHIENVGPDELLTMFWCNEIFDSRNADTYFEKVA